MKKPHIYLLFFAAIIFISLSAHTGDKSSSQAPLGHTGAPDETTCAACHSGGSYTGQILFELGDGSISEYIPGETYTISLSASYNALRYGFSITALNASNQPAGDFTVLNSDNTSKGVAGSGRQYIGHKNANNNNEWNFEWTAPEADEGTITFYYVINAANNNNAPSGDYIETGTSSFTEGEAIEKFEVVFNVDMSHVSEYFNPDLDIVYITGKMFDWAVPGNLPLLQTMTRIGDSFIFTKTLQLQEGEYEYKYFLNEGWNGGEWEAGPIREITVTQIATVNDIWGLISQVFGNLLSLSPNPEDAGIVSGEAMFLANAIAQISATPAEGYVFDNWTDEDEVVVSNMANYQFNMPNSDLTLTANFSIGSNVNDLDKLQIAVFPNPSREYFTVRCGSKIIDIAITDINGRIIYNHNPDSYELHLNKKWNSGMYIIRVSTIEGVFTRKLIVK
jgi:uncharacterized repeat protein (TIGR02543 family)